MRESETPFFAADFPELCGSQLTEICIDTLDKNNVVWLRTVGFFGISIEVDLLFVSQTFLPLLYDVHAMEKKVTQQEYDKSDVLDDAVQSLLAMLSYLSYSLPKTPHRELEEAFLRALSREGSRIDLSKKDVRSMLRKYEFKSKPGPKPMPPDEPRKRLVIGLYDKLFEILDPGFDPKIKTPNKMQAIMKAVEYCNSRDDLKRVQGPPSFEMEDQLHGKRKAKQAATYLTAQVVGVTRRTVERHISESS